MTHSNVHSIDEVRLETSYEDLVWECGCGCAHFMLCTNGTAKCVDCYEVVPHATVTFDLEAL